MTTALENQILGAQEKEYWLPYHWLLKKAGKRSYQFVSSCIAEAISRHSAPGRVLDIGCGDGRGTFDLHLALQPSFTLLGVDMSERALAFARLMAPVIPFDLNGAGRIPCPSHSCSAAVLREVMEHVPEQEITPLFEEVKRVLSPGGLCVLTVPSTRRRKPLKHFRHYDQQDVLDLLAANGFDVVQIAGLGWWPPRSLEVPYRWLCRLPGCWRISAHLSSVLVSPARCSSILCAARKR